MNNNLPFVSDDGIKKYQKQMDQTLRKIFDKKIKQSFLIEIYHKVTKTLGMNIFNYFDINFTEEKLVTGDSLAIDYLVCRMIVGLHRSDSIFLEDTERTNLEKSEQYKMELVKRVEEMLKLKSYSADFFRKKPIVYGDEFNFFPVPYKLFAMCLKANEILIKHNSNAQLREFYVKIFNKSLAALTLIEDNFLDNVYPICRVIIELYIKLLLVELYPGLIDEHEKFSAYDWQKTCCGIKYPDEFEQKYSNRLNQKEKSKIKFLHYGWIDSLEGYHEIVKSNPYSISGLICFLKEKADYNVNFEFLESLHRMCHTYTHGNVTMTKYPLLHYFELNLMLGLTIPHSLKMLSEHFNDDTNINGIDIFESIDKDLQLLVEQYRKRSAANFDKYYNYKNNN